MTLTFHDPITKATEVARLADDKKAENVTVLDVRNVCPFTDVLVICEGSTNLQLKAIANSIHMGLKQAGAGTPITDGASGTNWIVLDYGDVIVHIMNHEARFYYRLEDLWGDGEEVAWSGEGATTESVG
ncbi:MAG: ribosome silencing factor [Sumerlaeia bacterium]